MMLVVHVVMMLTVALGLVVLVVHRDCSVLLQRGRDKHVQYELSTSFFNPNLLIKHFETNPDGEKKPSKLNNHKIKTQVIDTFEKIFKNTDNNTN